MSLQNVQRIASQHAGKASWRLLDQNGLSISVFDEYCRHISDESFSTKQRYAIVVSRFIDYLYEVGVLGGPPVSRRVVNEAIGYYLLLLAHGESISLAVSPDDLAHEGETDHEKREEALRAVARRLKITCLRPGSWSNTLAALNRFLRLCTLLENEARELAQFKGGLALDLVEASSMDYMPLLQAVDGCIRLNRQEVEHIKHSSMLGGVIRFRGSELNRPRGLSASRKKSKQQDLEALDFPMQHFSALLEATGSWRDKALWTLLAASGIRRSEALNLEWHHVDFENETVYVLDPEFTRYGRDIPESERAQRFKGRAVSWTYLRQPYRSWFFQYLLEYRQHEYILPADGNDYVFQYLKERFQGRPLREAADSTLNEAFTSVVRKARIPGPPMAPDHVWTAHSLRHAFGMFMLNDFEVPGQTHPGLTEAEVQLLMGHEDINSTRRYARPTQKRLRQKLERHDRATLSYADAITGLPPAIAGRLLNDASSNGR